MSEGARSIVTCDEDSTALVSLELAKTSAILPGEWLDTGDTVQGRLLLIDLPVSFEAFSREAADSIFIRHLAPVDLTIPIQGSAQDIETLVSAASGLADRLSMGSTFSVQTRVLGSGKLPYRKVVVNEAISQTLSSAAGLTMDCRHPDQVVSIVCTPRQAYLGVSQATHNRSEWVGGQHRLKADDAQISRSEFKLEEAIAVFDLALPKRGVALDIGASPGGWSRLLASRGLDVFAVDPGDLDARLKIEKRITHVRSRIQDFRGGPPEFDLIVNDMKMDARDSIAIMATFARRLKVGGTALMTLKLPKMPSTPSEARKLLDMVRLDLEALAQSYSVIGARQLFHNRSEFTVVLERSD